MTNGMLKMKIAHMAGALGISVILLSGCSEKAPSGQVIATVDGQDITRRDLLTEFGASNAARGVDIAAVQPALVEELVNRKLMVAQAKREGIDKTPEYLAAQQRSQDLSLVQQLVETWVGKQPPADAAELDRFVAANPQMFANRRVLVLDQIVTPAAGVDAKALEPLDTMEAIVAYLRERNHGFQRGTGQIDTISLPREAADNIQALAPGVPFVTSRGDQLVIAVVTENRPQPVPPEEQRALAAKALQQQQMQKTVAQRLETLRVGTKIEYQQGFAPAARPAGR
ncbi:peptidylprolyl isomerase [Sphingomonas sp. Leaf343]|uniref:peptidylprolyl isomerase n=1 Tax=Sphingomonas sp. Leaf343 TaxID=1736345 RepID=UPI0006F27792|nr:peptidylprolyl isomerase [Sphingomonas sp. Leaf343]KQR80205.1 hypothetical protein ASG07_15540 [Sphingomonas sp. Leaf343]